MGFPETTRSPQRGFSQKRDGLSSQHKGFSQDGFFQPHPTEAAEISRRLVESRERAELEQRFFSHEGFFLTPTNQRRRHLPKTERDQQPASKTAKRVESKTRRPHPEGERRSRGNNIYTIIVIVSYYMIAMDSGSLGRIIPQWICINSYCIH